MKKVLHGFLKQFDMKIVALNLGLAALYIISGKLGLSLAFVNPSATAVWAPTGIALAAFLLFGFRITPAIFLGAFLVNITTAGSVFTCLGIALGNTLEGIAGVYLVNTFANGKKAFSNLSDVFKFTFFAGMLSTMISADIGVISLILGGLAAWRDFWSIWVTWWLGDMGGNLLVAPLLLVWATNQNFQISYRKLLHLVLSLFILWIMTIIVFTGLLPFPYLCIPIAIWIAFWFGRRGATVTTIIVAGVAIYYTLHGLGPFARDYSINESLVLLQLFLGVLSITSLTFSVLVHAIRKGEKTLASSEQRFQALIEKSFDAVVLIDPTSRILYASPSVKKVLGYSPEELIGKTGFDLVAPQYRPMTMRELSNLILTPGGSVTVKYQTIRKDQKLIWVEATGTNLLLEDSVHAVVVNFRDITQEKIWQEKILQEKTRDEALLESIGDGLLATDSAGKIIMVNQAACQILGWKEKELIGKSIFAQIPMENENGKVLPIADRPMTKVLSLRKPLVTSETNYYIRKDTTKVPVRFTITPVIINRKLIGTIEVFYDITKEKEVDRMKDEFISIASHELRTPMTAIKGLLSMIIKGDYGSVNEGLKKPLNNINLSAERQITLINDLLNVSRLQTGKITFKLVEFSLRSEIDEILKLLQPLATQKNITLAVKEKEDIMVQGDVEWSKHIIGNLLSNALKFTDKGGITVDYRQVGDLVYIEVTDTGIGIDPEDYKKLFGKFQQISMRVANKLAGSGLGLFLSKELARKMGGDVQLEKSVIGKGSTFVFLLPKAGTAAAQQTEIALSKEKR